MKTEGRKEGQIGFDTHLNIISKSREGLMLTSFGTLPLLGLKHPMMGLFLPAAEPSATVLYLAKHSGDSVSSW